MGEMSEFPLHMRAFLRTYRWRRIDPLPWHRLEKPLSECRVAIATSAGLIAPGERPFDSSVLGGDFSFRWISAETPPRTLIETHRSESWDHRGVTADPNVAFPLDRLHEMQAEGVIGEVNHRHPSFMGSLTAPGRLIRRSAPAIAEALVEDQVDVALLVPV
jgi:D-proline reductase (dithiol) PrdB